MNNENRAIPIEYLDRTEKVHLTNVAQIDSHFQQRQTFFHSRLALYINAKNQTLPIVKQVGWETITDIQGVHLVKNTGPYREGALFTAKECCVESTFALYDALTTPGTVSENVQVRLVEFITDLDRENQNSPLYRAEWAGHIIIMVNDVSTGQRRFYDGAYAEIDHREVGTIKSFTETEFHNAYSIQPGSMRDAMCRRSEEKQVKKISLNDSIDQFQKVVATLL